jgi:hypothetical protein
MLDLKYDDTTLKMIDYLTNSNFIKERRAKFLITTTYISPSGYCDAGDIIWYYFWTPEKHPQGSNYFAVYLNPYTENFTIVDGIGITTKPIRGFWLDDKFHFSKSQHHIASAGGEMIDGGRLYYRQAIREKYRWGKISVVDGNLLFRSDILND